ncbi:MAG TPA: T9SS type A sorting domain-containing protein [Flavipsychrobacter sp.]|nr:T9SS type A sorting domain-containing protein [Flavipsychrobacter sp.]
MKRILSTMMFLGTVFNATAQTAQFTIKAITSSVLEVYFKPNGNIDSVETGISNVTFVLQIPQTFSNPQGAWTVTPNATYLGTVSTTTATSTVNGNMYNTLFSWTSNPNINGTSFTNNVEYLLATITTPTGVGVSNVTIIDWGNNRLDNSVAGAPLWATSIAIDGLDRTNNTALFYGNTTTSAPSNSGSTTGASTLTANGVPLSVKLVEFYGKVSNQNIVLNWIAKDEKDLDVYEVEYTGANGVWEKIGAVEARNNTTANYSYLHSPKSGEVHNYRLKVKEKNGDYFYSKVISFQHQIYNEEVKLYPNVVRVGEPIRVSFATKEKIKELKVTDNNGKLVRIINGTNTDRLDLETHNFATGTYYLIIVSDRKVTATKFLIQ